MKVIKFLFKFACVISILVISFVHILILYDSIFRSNVLEKANEEILTKEIRNYCDGKQILETYDIKNNIDWQKCVRELDLIYIYNINVKLSSGKDAVQHTKFEMKANYMNCQYSDMILYFDSYKNSDYFANGSPFFRISHYYESGAHYNDYNVPTACKPTTTTTINGVNYPTKAYNGKYANYRQNDAYAKNITIVMNDGTTKSYEAIYHNGCHSKFDDELYEINMLEINSITVEFYSDKVYYN